MASRGVDALANRAAQLDLNDGPTLLGEGVFGKVYKETRTVDNTLKVCAVKKLNPGKTMRMEDAVKEVDTLMSLNHEHIIKCYGHHYEDNGRRLCIVMEYADQGTFTKVVTEEAQKQRSVCFKEYNIWRFLRHLSGALDYLHTLLQPILHRDLKPDNVLCMNSNSTGPVKLCDFDPCSGY